MAGSRSVLLFKISQCLLTLLFILPLATPKVMVQVTSDQPVMMGSNITFTTTLLNPEQPSYDIQWTELSYQTNRRGQDVLTKANGYKSVWTLDYTDEKIPGKPFLYPGTYTVTATVTYQYLFFTVNVGTWLSDYSLTKNFTGTFDIQQPGVYKKNPSFISTANQTNFAVQLHDPHNYLGGAINVTWSWFNQTSFIANTTTPKFSQNITKEGEYLYNVTLSAVYNSSTTPNATTVRTGTWISNVVAKVPITNFTVVGEMWFPHGRLLNLKVICAGSKPYTYCIQMHPGPYNLTGNETCIYPEVTNVCEIPYVWYFSEPGIHSLVIIMENDVSRVVNRTLVNVYKVSKQQPLSIIVVPLTCTLIALVMIIFGIAYFWENRARYSVEVADFDFGQHDDLPYMTFVERLKDALSSTTSSRQRLYNSTDDEPILNSRRASQFS